LQNGFYTTEDGQLLSLYNLAATRDKNGATKILFSDDELGKQYQNWDDFWEDYLPKLERYLNDQSVSPYAKPRERLIWLGGTRYRDAFRNFDFIWDYNSGIVPRANKTALTWLSYCDFIVSNATLVYGVLENDKEIMDIAFNLDRNLFQRILHLRRVARGEFYPEWLSKSILWRDKIEVDPNVTSNPAEEYFERMSAALPQAA
jgi:hypothetical protein